MEGVDGNFYGTTSKGGTSGFGTVFKISPTGLFTLLVSFENADGHNPSAALIVGSDGNFYGTTPSGGTLNAGTVFKVTPAGTLTTLASLDNAAGLYPSGVIQGNDGNFYETAAAGGNEGAGTVFKVTPAGVLTRVVSFTTTTAGDPKTPLALGSDGNFYGQPPSAARNQPLAPVRVQESYSS
ncbi:MAG: 3-carboxymuconate cyclase [Chthoniobacteraceae bacterium]|nr:3-carboxymuconate cyclase [Chthoniobacteraceae bacterium]